MKTLVFLFNLYILTIASANGSPTGTLPQEPEAILQNNITFLQNDNTGSHPIFYAKRNDTIFEVTVYNSNENTDSLVVSGIYVHYKKPQGKLWVCHLNNGEIKICQFEKAKYLSKAYMKANDNSYWEAEYRMHGYKLYDQNMKLIAFEKYHGNKKVYKYVYH